MDIEEIMTLLLPELVEDIEKLMPAILLPEEVLESGSKAKD